MELIKIKKDKKRAKSLVKLAMLRYSRLNSFDIEKDSSLIAESYYEICKELITALLFLEGYKTLSHKTLISFLKRYDEFSDKEIAVLDDLRVRRNKIVYEGVFVNEEYIKRNRKYFESIIKKLKQLIYKKV